MLKYDYRFTDEMRQQLNKALENEKVIGHFPPDLFFCPQEEMNQAESADQQADPQPDDSYYQAQGQEPPPAKKRHWWNNAEVNAMLLAMAAILVLLVVCPSW